MAGPLRRDVEQRPLTVYSRAHSRGVLRKEQIQGGYVAAANRLGCLVLHLADDSFSLMRLCLPIDSHLPDKSFTRSYATTSELPTIRPEPRALLSRTARPIFVRKSRWARQP